MRIAVAKETKSNALDWGRVGWICHSPNVGAAQLAIVEGAVFSGKGHNFHKHPRQEEVIYVVSGLIEQWIGEKKQLLEPGDAAFIAPNTVHASFNVGDREARILAIFGPSVGDGFETVDMAGEAPWNKLRG
jgi:quercetin dioxygenase-like cupin family protein